MLFVTYVDTYVTFSSTFITLLNGKRLLNYILCIRFFSGMPSIVSASQFSYTNLSQGCYWVSVSLFPVYSCIFPELSRLFSPHIRQQLPQVSVWFGSQIIRESAYHIIQPLSGIDTTFLTWAKQGADYSHILSRHFVSTEQTVLTDSRLVLLFYS